LAEQKFEHAAQQIVFQDGIDAIEDALARLRRLEAQLFAIVPSWSMAPVVEAYQAMRGASFLVAVTVAAELGDLRRFDNPRQLISAWSRANGRPATPCGAPASPLPAIGMPGECWSKPPGAIAIRRASARPFAPGSRASQKQFARLPGRRKSGSAAAIAGSAPPAKSCLW
jgi:hypothetical protein